MSVELAALGLALAAIALVAGYTLRTGAPPHWSAGPAREALIGALPDIEATTPGTVYELGAGWGTLALPLARRYPGRPVIALELSPVPWAVAWLRARLAGTPNLQVVCADLFGADLSRAAVVVCFLHGDLMARLAPKLAAELPDGAWVLSNFFRLPGWTPVAEIPVADRHATRILVYRSSSLAGVGTDIPAPSAAKPAPLPLAPSPPPSP